MSPQPPPPDRADDDEPDAAAVAAARHYDTLAGLHSGYHEHLRLSARRMGLRDRGAGLRLLDLGCGTGASTAALLDAAPDAEVTGVDISPEMLARARAKTWPSTVRFVEADVDDLVAAGITGPYDGVLVAHLLAQPGLRGLTDRNAVLRAARSLLAPGAPLAVHEYSVTDSVRSRLRWNAVSWSFLVPVARMRTGSGATLRAQRRSVLGFDGVEAFTARMIAVGFEDIRVQTMPGWQQHVLHTFLGRSPGAPAGGDTDAWTPPAGVDLVK